MGIQAHIAINNSLESIDKKNGNFSSPQFYLPNLSGGRKGGFFVDYQRIDSKGNKEFYEIKPISYMGNNRGDKQLEKYIQRDGEAIKGMELMADIAEMGPIETVMSTPYGVENITINLKVDPANHPGMIFYELDDGRTSLQEKMKVAETLLKPVVGAAMMFFGIGGKLPIPETPNLVPTP